MQTFQHEARSPFRGSVLATLSGVAGGVTTVLWLPIHASSIAVVGVRGLCGLLLFGSISKLSGKTIRPNKSTQKVVLMGGLMFAGLIFCWVNALRHVPVVVVLIVGAATPAMTALVEHFVFHTRLSRAMYLCIALVTIGAGLSVIGAPSGDVTAFGIVLILGFLTLDIAYALFTSVILKDIEIIPYLCAISTIVFVLFAIPTVVSGLGQLTINDLGWIACITVSGGLVGWGLFHEAQKHLSTGVITALGLISAPVGTFLAWQFADQEVNIGEALSGILVILFVAVLLVLQSREQLDRTVQDAEAISDLKP